MADQAITDYTEQATARSDLLIEVVDLNEAAAADQNKKLQLGTIFDAIVTYNGDYVTLNGNAVFY